MSHSSFVKSSFVLPKKKTLLGLRYTFYSFQNQPQTHGISCFFNSPSSGLQHFSSNNFKLHTYQCNITRLFLNGARQGFSKCLPVVIFPFLQLSPQKLSQVSSFHRCGGLTENRAHCPYSGSQMIRNQYIGLPAPTPGLDLICGSIFCPYSQQYILILL